MVVNELPREVIQKLRSGVAISTLSQAVEELVCNSIDARAVSVDVSVCVASGFVEVRDNGVGMDLADLLRCGNRYCTSKIGSLSDLRCVRTLGYRGEAVASIGEIAILTIQTQAGHSGETMEKRIKGGQVMTAGLSSSDRGPGTTITVRDMFFNVRRPCVDMAM
jgi:DNA mismatch repair protein MutL